MRRILIVIIGLTISGCLFSQGLFESSVSGTESGGEESRSEIFSGYVRGSAFGLSETYDYSLVFTELSLRTDYSSRKIILKSDIRFRSGLFFNEKDNQIELKEVYGGYRTDKLDILLGNQLVMWGRTDGFNPTNNINPQNYFFLSAEPDDQIMSNFMLRLRYRINGNIDADVVGIPFYIPSVYRYDLFQIGDFGDLASFGPTIIPDRSFKNSAFAARLNFEYPFAGFSISYFDGYSAFTGFNLQGITWSDFTPAISLAGESFRMQTPGIDFAIPVKSWIIRGEAAYKHTKDYQNNIHIPNPDISYVLGLDKRFSDLQVILQYVGVYTLDFKRPAIPQFPTSINPADWLDYAEATAVYEMGMFNRKIFMQQKETNHAIMLSLAKPFAYETINTELTGYYNLTSEEIMLRAKLAWKPADNISLSGGGFYMSGPDNSLFSYSGKVLGGAFLELKASF
jgi:hypothetical protein